MFKTCPEQRRREARAARTGPWPPRMRGGAAIDNFAEFYWSYYKPDMQSKLFDQIMRAEAALLDRFEVDYYYPDGSGENTNQYPPVMHSFVGFCQKTIR